MRTLFLALASAALFAVFAQNADAMDLSRLNCVTHCGYGPDGRVSCGRTPAHLKTGHGQCIGCQHSSIATTSTQGTK
jgi:hypothetical protein